LPYETIRREKGLEPDRPAVIFGAGNKLRAGGPYRSLLQHFEERLEGSQALLIVGYSFRDAHVNAILTEWVNADHARRMVVLDKSAERLGAFPRNLLDMTFGNYLWWMASSHPERVQLIPGTAKDGLADAITAAVKGWT